jgi:hypothetical protein
MKERIKSKDQKKLLEIPMITLRHLAQLATNERMSVKAYMEKVLIEHAKNSK